MTDKFAVIYTTTPTSIGTQSYTSSDLGSDTASWGVILISGATANGANADAARTVVGFFEAGGSEGCASDKSRDNVQPQPHISYGSNANCVVIPNTGSTNLSAGVANFDSTTAGGFVLNWTEAPTEAHRMIILMGSGSANAAVGVVQGTDTSETVGFQPDFLITTSLDGSYSSPFSANVDVIPGLGFAVRLPSLAQSALFGEWVNGADPTDGDALVSSSYFGGTVQAGADNGVFITAFTSTGWTQDQTAGSADILYLAVKLTDSTIPVRIAIETLPSGTGSQAFTGLGIQPRVALFAANLLTTTGSIVDGATAATYAAGAFSSTVQACVSESFQEGLDTSVSVLCDSRSRADAKALTLLSHLGAVAAEATWVSNDPTGFTWNFSTATAGRLVVFAIGAAAQTLAVGETEEISESVALAVKMALSETVEITDGFVALQETIGAIPDGENERMGGVFSGGSKRGGVFSGGSEAGGVF